MNENTLAQSIEKLVIVLERIVQSFEKMNQVTSQTQGQGQGQRPTTTTTIPAAAGKQGDGGTMAGIANIVGGVTAGFAAIGSALTAASASPYAKGTVTAPVDDAKAEILELNKSGYQLSSEQIQNYALQVANRQQAASSNIKEFTSLVNMGVAGNVYERTTQAITDISVAAGERGLQGVREVILEKMTDETEPIPGLNSAKTVGKAVKIYNPDLRGE